ncbi:MAG: hypothetical protein ACI8RZ_004465 [Myxococcota bacterium]|jgi:hypothetical protein
MANPTFVLIIGADDYRDLDPTGGSDLYGATNDAIAWWRLCHHHLRIDGSNIRILSRADGGTPLTVDQLTDGHPEQASAVTIADATRANILDGIQWLGEQIRIHNGSGLVTFSGHGVGLRARQLSEEGSTEALAPADITAITLDQLVTAADYDIAIKASAGAAGSQLTDKQTLARITNIFDACYDRSADGAASRSLGGLEDVVLPPRILSRLMLGCQLFQSSYEIWINAQWRGAFSHSVQTLMERWNTAVDDKTGVRYLQCSYDDLMFRSREHLNLLGVPQTPTLISGMARTSLVPVLRPGNHLAEGDTVPVPNAPMRWEEVSPGTEGVVTRVEIYVILANQSMETIGYGVLPVGANSSGNYNSGCEYWYFNKTLLQNSSYKHGFGDNKRKIKSTNYNSWPTDFKTTLKGSNTNAVWQSSSWPAQTGNWTTISSNYPPSMGNIDNKRTSSHWGGVDLNNQKYCFQFIWDTNNGDMLSMITYSQIGNDILTVKKDSSTDPVTIKILNKVIAGTGSTVPTIYSANWSMIDIDVTMPPTSS